jgi:hypothetical protein
MARSAMRDLENGSVRRLHPYAWLWEPLEAEEAFVLGSMFGTKVAYLDGQLMLCFAARKEPWRGLLVCTDRERQPALRAEFPLLAPHPILPKWLYLPEADEGFERVAARLVQLARERDPRLGVAPRPRGRGGRRPRPPG